MLTYPRKTCTLAFRIIGMGADILGRYLPEHAVAPCFELIKQHSVHVKIVNERRTRHGDYRRHPDGSHQITVNGSLNPYRFLMTFIHEIAHLVAMQTYGRHIKPHGEEWKHCFRQLMLPFLHPSIFPPTVLPLMAQHFKNPTASSDTDAHLTLALRAFDREERTHQYIHEIPNGSFFRIADGRVFQKKGLRVKRYECVEWSSGRSFVFHANAPVEAIPAPKIT